MPSNATGGFIRDMRTFLIHLLTFSLLFTFVASFWCWQGSCDAVCDGMLPTLILVNREAVPLVHTFTFFYFSLHTLLYFRERVVRNDSLIQRLGRQRSGVV